MTGHGSLKGVVIAQRLVMEQNLLDVISENVKGEEVKWQGFPKGKPCWMLRVATSCASAARRPAVSETPRG